MTVFHPLSTFLKVVYKVSLNCHHATFAIIKLENITIIRCKYLSKIIVFSNEWHMPCHEAKEKHETGKPTERKDDVISSRRIA